MKKRYFVSIFGRGLAFVAIISAATGCGPSPLGRKPTKYMSVSGAHVAPDSALTAADGTVLENGEYICPSTENVVPSYDWNLTGNDHFSVCKSQNSDYRVLVHGKTETDTICMFPAQYYDDQHIVYKWDQSGAPMVTCQKVGSNGVIFTFDKTSYNAAFIVEGYLMSQMQGCLMQQNYSACPAFAYGKFR